VDIVAVRPSELSRDDVALWSAFQAGQGDLSSPFLSAHWPRYVEMAETSAASRVRVAVIRDGGRTRGFLPVAIRGGIATAAGAPVCACQGVVAEPGLALDAGLLINALGVSRIDIAQAPLSQAAFAPHLRSLGTSWIARLPFGYDVYAADKALESNILETLDRRRQIADRDAGGVLFTPVSRALSDFTRLGIWRHENHVRAGKIDAFAALWAQQLLHELFSSRDPSFGGALFTLHFGDTLAAAQFHLMGGQTIHAWLGAQNPAFDRHSPTLLLTQEILRWMDDTAYTALNLGPGGAAHLRRLANDGCDIGRGFVGRPGGAALLRRAARSLPLGAVSGLPARALRRMAAIGALR